MSNTATDDIARTDGPADLRLDARSMTWLLTHSRPAADFFCRGVQQLRPIDDQTFLGRVVATADFVSGDEPVTAIAFMAPSPDGLHRLLNVALHRPGDRWPTLCSELERGVF